MFDEKCFLVFFIVIGLVFCKSIDYRKASIILAKGSNQASAEDGSLLSVSDQNHITFIHFMRDYERVYATSEELFTRLEAFKENLRKAEELKKIDNGTAQYGITPFSDYFPEELQKYTGFRFPNTSKTFDSVLNRNNGIDETGTTEDAYEDESGDDDYDIYDMHIKEGKLPVNFDWRDKKYVISSVKTQLTCQCCWAFSAAGTLEAMNAIKTKKLTELSVQQLVDCDDYDYGCNGGLMETAYRYVQEAGGLETAATYPFVGYTYHGCLASKNDGKEKVQVKSYKMITSGEETMKKLIYEKGPLAVGINANGLFYYRSGVLSLTRDSCDPSGLNHAVIIVGYGEEKTSRGDSIPYWIIKNSWGTAWGEKGFFRIKRNSDVCGISRYVMTVDPV